YLGAAGAIGVAFMLVFVAINSLITPLSLRLQSQALSATDSRVKLTSEVLTGIKIVKFFAWENALTSRIQELRQKELLPQLKLRIVEAGFTGMFDFLPSCVTVIIFGCYYALGNPLTLSVVFAGISIVNLLRLPVAIFPYIVQLHWSGHVSFRRISELLAVDELDSPPTFHNSSENPTAALVVSNASFVWPESRVVENDETVIKSKSQWRKWRLKKERKERLVEKKNGDKSGGVIVGGSKIHLANVNLSIRRGTLTVIVGKVGSGKSSLLSAIIGDMTRTNGSVDIFGTVGLTPQTAWLQHATLRDNILFGKEYNQDKYHAVIKACALARDLTLLPDGDMSEIGEKGVNLSGGQAARVNLARTIYADPDLMLLDDPLAAVDSHVGRSILENCILGLCKSKTVILVTHHLHIASYADLVILMEEGRIVEQGSYDTLMKDGKTLAAMMADKASTKFEKDAEIVNKGKDTTTALVVAEERQEGVISKECYRS
ncbi:Multidrug resistance-associated protein 9, partial [Blyttiomyces sp. JEL0837]